MNAISMSTHGFMPHGMCYLWRPEILWLHVGSDIVIALAYFSIPAAMLVFARRRPDLAYRPVVMLFTAFIVLCGTTHLLSIWTVWSPQYLIEGAFKALTALASIATAVALWPLLPRALALPARDDLEIANAQLREENARRAEAEAKLTALTASLERRVEERTQELRRANGALQQFASVASHDLRAPVRHIGVFAEMLEKEDGAALSEGGRETLSRMRISAGRMQTLIDGLLGYARLVNTPPDPKPVDLTEVARRAADLHALAVERTCASLELGALSRAHVDGVLVERVFDNLIANALKHGGPSPVIRIEDAPADAGPGMVGVSVTDNGPGVPEEHAEMIFGMLNRLTAETEGLGAGLAYSRTIIESHGGSIWVDSAYEGGARFLFTLPAAP